MRIRPAVIAAVLLTAIGVFLLRGKDRDMMAGYTPAPEPVALNEILTNSLSEFPEVLARMTAEKTQAFVLICGGGTVPEEAGELLSAKGFVLREILPAGGEEPERIALKIRSSVQ